MMNRDVAAARLQQAFDHLAQRLIQFPPIGAQTQPVPPGQPIVQTDYDTACLILGDLIRRSQRHIHVTEVRNAIRHAFDCLDAWQVTLSTENAASLHVFPQGARK